MIVFKERDFQAQEKVLFEYLQSQKTFPLTYKKVQKELPIEPKNRRCALFAGFALRLFGPHCYQKIVREKFDKDLQKEAAKIWQVYSEIQEPLAKGIKVAPASFSETSHKFVSERSSSSSSESSFFPILYRASFDTLPFLANMLLHPLDPSFSELPQEVRKAREIGCRLLFQTLNDPIPSSGREEEKKEDLPAPQSEKRVALAKVYYGAAVLYYRRQQVSLFTIVNTWRTAPGLDLKDLKEGHRREVVFCKLNELLGLSLWVPKNVAEAVQEMWPVARKRNGFRDFLILFTIEVLQESIRKRCPSFYMEKKNQRQNLSPLFSFSAASEKYLFSLFKQGDEGEAIRSEVAFFMKKQEELSEIDWQSQESPWKGLRPRSKQILTAFQVLFYFIRVCGVEDAASQSKLLDMILFSKEGWSPDSVPGFSSRQQETKLEYQSLYLLTKGTFDALVELLPGSKDLELRDEIYQDGVAWLLFLLLFSIEEEGARPVRDIEKKKGETFISVGGKKINVVQEGSFSPADSSSRHWEERLFGPLANIPGISLSLSLIYGFCLKNRALGIGSFLIDVHQNVFEVIKKHISEEEPIRNGKALILNPPVKWEGLDFGKKMSFIDPGSRLDPLLDRIKKSSCPIEIFSYDFWWLIRSALFSSESFLDDILKNQALISGLEDFCCGLPNDLKVFFYSYPPPLRGEIPNLQELREERQKWWDSGFHSIILNPEDLSHFYELIHSFAERLIPTCVQWEEKMQIEIPIKKSLQHGFFPSGQFVVDSCQVSSLEPGKVVYNSPKIEGEYKEINGREGIGVYLFWDLASSFPILCLSFSHLKKRTACFDSVRFPFSFEEMPKEAEKEALMKFLFEVAELILGQCFQESNSDKKEIKSSLFNQLVKDHRKSNFEKAMSYFVGLENIFKTANEVLEKQVLEKAFNFVFQITTVYINLFFQQVSGRAPPVKILDKRTVTGWNALFWKSSLEEKQLPAIGAGGSVEKFFLILKNGEEVPVFYRSASTDEMRESAEDAIPSPADLDSKFVTLSVQFSRNQRIEIPLQYPREVLKDLELFGQRLAFHLAALKEQCEFHVSE